MSSSLASFLFEVGQLKQTPRSGWQLLGIQSAESVAEHSHRVCVVAWGLAIMDEADVGRVLELAAIHDVPEARTGDFHRLSKNYVDAKAAGRRALEDQAASLPPELALRLRDAHAELEAGESAEAIIVHDADRLECLLQAREYAQQGYDTAEWIQSSQKALVGERAKALAVEILSTDPGAWQQG